MSNQLKLVPTLSSLYGRERSQSWLSAATLGVVVLSLAARSVRRPSRPRAAPRGQARPSLAINRTAPSPPTSDRPTHPPRPAPPASPETRPPAAQHRDSHTDAILFPVVDPLRRTHTVAISSRQGNPSRPRPPAEPPLAPPLVARPPLPPPAGMPGIPLCWLAPRAVRDSFIRVAGSVVGLISEPSAGRAGRG